MNRNFVIVRIWWMQSIVKVRNQNHVCCTWMGDFIWFFVSESPDDLDASLQKNNDSHVSGISPFFSSEDMNVSLNHTPQYSESVSTNKLWPNPKEWRCLQSKPMPLTITMDSVFLWCRPITSPFKLKKKQIYKISNFFVQISLIRAERIYIVILHVQFKRW